MSKPSKKVAALAKAITSARSGDVDGAVMSMEEAAEAGAQELRDAAKKPRPTVRKTQNRALRCELTPDQMREYGERLAANQKRRSELDYEKQDWVKAWKRRRATVENEAESQGSAIRSKFEVRDIPCEVALDYEKQTVHTVRNDTGETIEDRRMTNDELSQLPL